MFLSFCYFQLRDENLSSQKANQFPRASPGYSAWRPHKNKSRFIQGRLDKIIDSYKKQKN